MSCEGPRYRSARFPDTLPETKRYIYAGGSAKIGFGSGTGSKRVFAGGKPIDDEFLANHPGE